MRKEDKGREPSTTSKIRKWGSYSPISLELRKTKTNQNT
jgi:hypothetical protein